MSLQVDDAGRRSRSRSPSGRPSAAIERSPSGRDRDRDRSRDPLDRDALNIARAPYPGDNDDDGDGGGRRRRGDRSPRLPSDDASYRQTKYESVEIKRSDSRREKEYRYEKEEERDRKSSRDLDKEKQRLIGEDKLSFLPAKYAVKTVPTPAQAPALAPISGRERDMPRSAIKMRSNSIGESDEEDEVDDEDLAYGGTAMPAGSTGHQMPTGYAHNLLHHDDDDLDYADRRPKSAAREDRHYRHDSFGRDPRASGSNVLTIDTGHRSGRDRSPAPTKDMARLSVGTLSPGALHHSSKMSLSSAPGSPLLESYHGTYQSMSPMPSPMLLASQGPRTSTPTIMDINGPESDDEQGLGAGGGGGGDKIRRRARFYDPETDAKRLAKALRGDRHPPDVEPLIEILPGLTNDQVLELRIEYKRIVKTGPDRLGVNISKHIKARLKDEDPALMKVCYATALGKWESEAYWANFWYHGDKTRRELLIESLMGRTNAEIHQIKRNFSDKKYGDSLTKCMRTELNEDKFKRAVLFVLDEQRMDDYDRDGRLLPVNMELVRDDAVSLYHAVRSERGGETATINVVVQRSDTHLREVLRLYSSQYQSNFARDCLKKSGNLVGEMLAHILNGVINKPVRDASLVHHALTASKRDGLRRELLISRLVRYHWDSHHMAAIKAAYRSRYDRDMQDAIRDATGQSDWGLFCRELCITRHPDEVKSVERVDIHHKDRRG
ncbi:annexin [Grosmannia clavigera kw1407]|uniref:Annexin n=1 Tax=Grosmannia clavigera (strain kw1407 / UAMH 11150) TaxID=655863 RepID=F0XHQ6_GROCL|nr:annexin [Grosmannia clavigera kw1407]EFX03330.1 annexin [Grosmannia clavigera kw1407]